MISIEVFMLGLLITSTLVSLVTEAVKTILSEHNATYQSNTLAGIVALVLSAAVSGGYVAFTGISFTPQVAVCSVALVFMSWLCAMVGYDKVVQAISQFKTIKKGE